MVEAKTFKISPRLDYLFQQLQPGTDVWDLACDHGLVGMKAVVSGQFPSVTFVDKSVEAVEVLKRDFCVKLGGFDHSVDVAIVNGDMLEVPLPSENASLVVAGVGAHLICRFIKRVPLGSNLTLVLGPNKNPDEVERALKDLGWHITSQEVLIEKGRERTVFTAIVEGSIELQRAGDRRNQ